MMDIVKKLANGSNWLYSCLGVPYSCYSFVNIRQKKTQWLRPATSWGFEGGRSTRSPQNQKPVLPQFAWEPKVFLDDTWDMLGW